MPTIIAGRFRAFAFTIVCGAAVAACGGDPGPKPLAHHFDDMHIAGVPLDKKHGMLEAQQEYAAAKQARMKVEADYNEAGTDLDIARNERKQAKLAEESARSKKKRAQESGNMNRVDAATPEVRAAELRHRAAAQKVEFIETKRKYLAKKLRSADEQMYADEAVFELAKAKIAKNNNIRPKNFSYEAYEKQATNRSQRAQKSRESLAELKLKAEAKRKEWLGLEQEASRVEASTPQAGTSDDF